MSRILKKALATGAVAALAVSLIPVAQAKSYHRFHATTYDQNAQADHIRAKSADPGGSYRAYPDWARYALSPKR